MTRMMLVSALALTAAVSAARAQSVDTHLPLIDRLRDAARPPIVRIDLMCDRKCSTRPYVLRFTPDSGRHGGHRSSPDRPA